MPAGTRKSAFRQPRVDMFRKKYDGSPIQMRPLHPLPQKSDIAKKPTLKKKYLSIDIRAISHSAVRMPDFYPFFYNLFSFIRAKLTFVVAAFAVVLVSSLIVGYIFLTKDFERVKALAGFQPEVVTKIYDKNGILISELFREKREVVPFEDIPLQLKDAFIAMEDCDFYDHIGINPKGIVRALFINVAAGRVKQGGSTITQQLAKILLTSGKRNIFRKVKDAFIALMIEHSYSKDEILSMYLNQIFLGQGAYGVEAASKLYFRKGVKQLGLAECALLATLPSAPNKYSPIRYPHLSQKLHRTALARMVDLGYITIAEAEKAYREFWPDYIDYIQNLPPTFNTWSLRVDNAPWVTEYVRRELIREYGDDKVYSGGLQVYTTFDLAKQRAAQGVMEEMLRKQSLVSGKMLFTNEDYFTENFSDQLALLSYLFDSSEIRRKGSLEQKKVNDYFQSSLMDSYDALTLLTGADTMGDLLDTYLDTNELNRTLLSVEGALISIDQKTGYIEALVGGSGFSQENQLNRVMQSYRQPGSSIKPLLYTAAFETRKFTAASAVMDAPLEFFSAEGGSWTPENYENDFHGQVRLRTALAKSINVVSVRLAEGIGIDNVIKYYSKFLRITKEQGDKRIPRNYSIALGSIEVTPFELARAYAIIANGGKDVRPFSIRYIKDRDGKIIENHEKETKEYFAKTSAKDLQVIEPATAQLMISMMRSVITSGTGGLASCGRPAAGKTGTTNNWRDAWFTGFTPELTTCIWVGYDKMGMTLGRGQTGGVICAPAWSKYMRLALRSYPVVEFPHYAGLESALVTNENGLLPGSGCRDVVEEVFIPGTVPVEYDQFCGRVSGANANPVPDSNISGRQREEARDIINSEVREVRDIGDDLLQ